MNWKQKIVAMRPLTKMTQMLAAALFLVLAPEISAAGNVFGTLGIGGGSSPLWSEDSQGGPAVAGTITYRMKGPSVSIRLSGLNALTPMFTSYVESVSEVAVMGGWDFFLPASVFMAFRVGLGRMSYHGGYPQALNWDYSGHAWGPAVQFDAYWKRIGLTYMVHTGDLTSFHAVLIGFRLGNIKGR